MIEIIKNPNETPNNALNPISKKIEYAKETIKLIIKIPAKVAKTFKETTLRNIIKTIIILAKKIIHALLNGVELFVFASKYKTKSTDATNSETTPTSLYLFVNLLTLAGKLPI